MLKRILLTLLVLIIAAVGFEVFKLLQLRGNIDRFAMYWKNYPTSGEFTYVALGDSAAQGIGASAPQYGYVGIVSERIHKKTGKTVRVVNLSVTGARVADVIRDQIPQLKNYKADLITLEIGGNDVNHWSPTDFQSQYDQLASVVPKGTVVSDVAYFGGRISRNKEALEAGNYIRNAALKNSLPLVELQRETQERDSIFSCSVDFFHPSNRGYRVWADAFWKTINPIIK